MSLDLHLLTSSVLAFELLLKMLTCGARCCKNLAWAKLASWFGNIRVCNVVITIWYMTMFFLFATLSWTNYSNAFYSFSFVFILSIGEKIAGIESSVRYNWGFIWFIILCLAAAAVGGYAVYKYRIRVCTFPLKFLKLLPGLPWQVYNFFVKYEGALPILVLCENDHQPKLVYV